MTALAITPNLTEEQSQAVRLAHQGKSFLLIGAAGVGKTHTTKEILRVCRSRGSVQALAPTGKAAKRLHELTGTSASTIHRYLGFLQNGENSPAQTLLIDEASMLDTGLFAELLRAYPTTPPQVILVGDDNQLPSIGAGRVLTDIIRSEAIPVVRLTKIFRQGEASHIPEFSRAFQQGRLGKTPIDNSSTLGFVSARTADDVVVKTTKLVTKNLQKSSGKTNRRAFELDEIQIVVGQRTGPIGADELNMWVQRLAVGETGERVRIGRDAYAGVGDRVINRQNDYDLQVMNGEVGKVVRVTPEKEEKGTVTVDFGDRFVDFPPSHTKFLQLAYALTVHSSQGSQFPCVVFVAHPAHRWMLTRRLAYTALTRAEEMCVIVGQWEALRAASRTVRDFKRRTLLTERLRGEM